jgi:PAS domain-containing protein
VQLALGQERGEQTLAGLATSGEMTILLDRKGRVVAMTEAAEQLFDCPNGLILDGLNVRLGNREEDRALQAATSRLLSSDGVTGPILHESIAGRSEGSPDGCWRLFLTRLPARLDLLGVEAQLALTLRPL